MLRWTKRHFNRFTMFSCYIFMINTESNIAFHEQCVVVHWAPALKGKKLITKPLSSQATRKVGECALECFANERCVALNFGPRTGEHHICELLKTDRHLLSSNFTASPGWTYVGKKSKCDTTPCPVNSSCVSNYEKESRICVDYGQDDEVKKYILESLHGETVQDMKFVDTQPHDQGCINVLIKGGSASGIYNITVNGSTSSVYCDQTTEGGGWLVVQRNVRTLSFYKTWLEYKDGFGDLNQDFWWGNEKMHQLTSEQSNFDLRIDLKHANGATGNAKYTGFKISGEIDGYRILLENTSYLGNIGDAMFYRNHLPFQSVGKMFTTKDRKHDTCPCNCAKERKSGWWYDWCSYADLNRQNIHWMTWPGTIVRAEMKIRPVAN